MLIVPEPIKLPVAEGRFSIKLWFTAAAVAEDDAVTVGFDWLPGLGCFFGGLLEARFRFKSTPI